MRFAFLFLLTAIVAGGADASVSIIDQSVSARAGYDGNPLGTGGASALVLGEADAVTYGAGAAFAIAVTPGGQGVRPAKLSYAGDVMRFDGLPSENFSTHRLALGGQLLLQDWQLGVDGSSLYVAGSRDTLTSMASANANAVATWRERRRQWQHRLRLEAKTFFGSLLVRTTGALLAYDYQTHVVAGKVAFADRSDVQGALDLGWKQNERSLWFVGVRPGHQTQATVALPGCAFDYSNDYTRLAAGWEGKPVAGTTVTIAMGPDFRRYTGTVDPTVFHGRDRTALWLDGSFASTLTKTVTLTGKAVRMNWLSSTGKSAYVDSCADAALSWAVSSNVGLRITGKIHRCDYFPVVRDDWESFVGAGLSFKASPRVVLTADLLRHRGWNHISSVPERSFHRFIVNLGATIRL